MKKLFLIVVVLLVFQKWEAIADYFNPAPEYAKAHDGQVILYATTWCGYCKKTRALLKDNHIPFYEYDIEKSAEGYEQYKNLGGRGVPVLLINGEVINGYDPNRILALARKSKNS